jgi:protein-tyrosine-phosphatase/tRNA A37 threonylcarbamoyladenosine synthetase subunit TsaC/SUA5/YrdC
MASPSPASSPPSPQDVQRFHDHLMAGKAVVLPTDTIPGIGYLAADVDAAQRLAERKSSPLERPFSLHLRSASELRQWIASPPPGLPDWLQKVLPGPLTVVLPKKWLDLPFDIPWPALGFRLPDCADYLQWMEQAPGPLWMSSVNRSGEAPLVGAALATWLEQNADVWSGRTAEAWTAGASVAAHPEPEPTSASQASAVLEFQPLPKWHRYRDDLQLPSLGLRILCVCTGNTCRSPMAEVILRQAIADAWGVQADQLDQLGWQIASAGTSAYGGDHANPNSLAAAEEIGLDLSSHRSQSLYDALQQPWDLVLAMGSSHLDGLPPEVPAMLLDPGGQSIPDPYGQSISVYRQTREQLVLAGQRWVERWQQWPESGQTLVTAGA